MFGLRGIGGFAFSVVMVIVLLQRGAALAQCASPPAAPDIKIETPSQTTVRAGEPLEIRWKSEGHRDKGCRYPLFLVFATKAHVRFEGEWFLAFPAGGGAGPFGISQSIDQTRVFIPLHALEDKASGSFKIKFYTAGENAIDWFVAGLPGFSSGGGKQAATVMKPGSAPLTTLVESGKPEIVVRDAFAPNLATSGAALERPKKTIASNSGEFSLQIFSRFYRVYDAATGELVLERTGINPNFSPSSRFIGAFADGPGFEIIDLYAGTSIFASGALNRGGSYEGTAHVAAWSRNDAFVTLSFWGYGGIHMLQTLVDRPGVGDGMASCHACQGIGVNVFVNYDTGMAAWAGQQKGWASLYDASMGSKQAQALAERQIPNTPDFDAATSERQQVLFKTLSSKYLQALGPRLFFDGKMLLDKLPNDTKDIRDGSAWRLGENLQLSHACTQDDNDNCSSLGSDSDQGRAELAALAKRRVNHNGRAVQKIASSLSADERLLSSRSASADEKPVRNVWYRLEQLGVPASQEARTEVAVQTLDWNETYERPQNVIDLITSKNRLAKSAFVIRKDGDYDIPGYVDETHETKIIDAKKVHQFAAWSIGSNQYRLIHENYQSGNSSTPMNQYLHLLTWDAAGNLRVSDLSTRLLAQGFIKNNGEIVHPLPTDFDIVTIVASRYLLASGHWLHDGERWALVYDLEANKIVFFNGDLPDATTTKALSITRDGQIFIAANSSGQIYFYSIPTGLQILKGYYVDDELAIYDVNAYYMSTLEGSQFVFLRFPGLRGYLSFKQFAKTLNRPDIIMDTLAGKKPPSALDLKPAPRLTLKVETKTVAPGRLQLGVSANASRQLAKVRLYFDGQNWKELPASGLDARIEDTIDFPAQARWLSAIAVDVDGNESAPVAQWIPRDSRPSARRLFAIAVGTDNYQNLPQNLQLHSAGYDANNFLGALQAQKSGYYDAIEATPFIDAPNLKTELPKVLRSIAQAATEDDTIMLFVAGHGYRAPDNKLYLVIKESETNNIQETALPWDELASAFNGARARIIAFIDACHSGAASDGGSNDEIAGTLLAHQVSFTVVAAAKGRQESFELDAPARGGVFTSSVVKAMTADRTSVDTNNNGVIELSELYRTIKPSILMKMNGDQTPWLARVDMIGEVPLF
jgi:hypothetical protein